MAVAAKTPRDPSTDFPPRKRCLPNLLPTTLPIPSPKVIATTPMVAAVQWSQKKATSMVIVTA